MVGDADALVDGEPVGDDEHEVLEPGLEAVVAGDADGDVDAGAGEDPDPAGHAGGVAGEDLQGEGDGVDVGAVVGDDGEGEDDEAELAEAAELGDENGGEQAADARVGVGGAEGGVVDAGGHDGGAEELGEAEGEEEAGEGDEEDAHAGGGRRVVAGVVGGVRGPAGGEAEDAGGEGEDGAGLGGSRVQGQHVVEVTRVGEDAEDDEEDDEAGDPGEALVGVDDAVAERADDEGRQRNDDDAGPSWHVVVHGVKELGADDGVDGGPAQACEDIEDGNFGHVLVAPTLEKRGSVRHTKLDDVVAVPIPGQNHLSKTKLGTKGREEAHGKDTEEVDEDDGQSRVSEAETENRNSKNADGKGRNDHVGGAPL